jgi:hypothetical protein
VIAERYGPHGSSELSVATDASGRVFVASEPADPFLSPRGDLQAAANSPGECVDDEYTHDRIGGQKYRWTGTLGWYFNAGTTPGEISAANALDDLQHGTENVKWANNNCGRADSIGATSSYLGTTSASAGVNVDSCAGSDGKSVVGFGGYGGDDPPLAAACTYAYLTSGTYANAVESDIKFDKDHFNWFTGSVPSGCDNRHSVEAVATHERGHSFGLDHVSETGHGKLTMSTNENGDCQKSEATLGLGDMLGLEALY